METVSMLLSVLFVSGALAVCPREAALSITAPQKMEALSGSCLQIPCNFSAASEMKFNNLRTTFGVWIKTDSKFGNNPNNVIFNSSGTVNKYPMKITGNLSQTNCTTLFSNLNTTYTDTYYFRIENGLFKATASCDPLQINVTDSPPSPTIKISKVNLKEKESVTISCSAFTPCPHSPPKLTWSLQQDPHNNREENTDGTFTTQIQETITLSEKHDGYNISCSATYPVNEGRDVRTAETQETLSVSYAPKDTSASISPSGLVSAGSWVNLTCSSRAKPPVSSFTWFKISTDGDKTVSEGDFYRLNVTDGGVYYCVATNQLGNQTSPEIHLNIEVFVETKQLLQWETVVGGILGIIVLICVVVAIWYKWFRSRHQSPLKQCQDPSLQDPATTTEEETIYYGEINLSNLRPQPSSYSAHHSEQQQDTVYAEVKVSKTAKSLTQIADGPEDLYAQVKKK